MTRGTVGHRGHRYIALAPRGLEDVAGREIERRLPGAGLFRRGGGTIVVAMRHGEDPRPLLDLHGIDDLFAETTAIEDAAPRRDLLVRLAEAIRRGEELEEALAARWAFRSAQRALTPALQWADLARFATPWDQRAAWPVPRKPTFRVASQVVGRQTLRRDDAQHRVVDSLARRFPAWVHRPTGPADLQFTVWTSDATCHVGLRLVEPGFARRPWKVAHIPASLPPSVAYGLVATTGMGDGEVVLDPFCGAGTILIERGLAAPAPARLWGADLSAPARAAAAANAAAARVTLSLHAWDATALRLDASSIDTIVTNPPYGHRLGQAADLPDLYGGFLAEAARVLRPRGRCVVLTAQGALLERLVAGRPEFAPRTRFDVDVLGVTANVYLLESTASLSR